MGRIKVTIVVFEEVTLLEDLLRLNANLSEIREKVTYYQNKDEKKTARAFRAIAWSIEEQLNKLLGDAPDTVREAYEVESQAKK